MCPFSKYHCVHYQYDSILWPFPWGNSKCPSFVHLLSSKCLIFGILIIVIQQLDGNVIGPKILGDSTGMRPLWIIFAITLGGWLAGVPGMLLGVPCVAVITGLMEDHVNEKLAEKNINLPVIKNEKVRKGKVRTRIRTIIIIRRNINRKIKIQIMIQEAGGCKTW